MLSAKHGGPKVRSDAEIIEVMAQRIFQARQLYPNDPAGTRQDDMYTSIEDARLYARAAFDALKKAGIELVEGDNAKGP